MPSSGPQESKCPGWLRPDASLPNVILPKRTLGRGANIFCRTEVEQQLQEALRVQNVPMHGKAPCVSPLASKAPSHSCSTGPGLLSSCPYSWGNPSSQRFYSVAASTLKDLAASPHMQWPTWFLALFLSLLAWKQPHQETILHNGSKDKIHWDRLQNIMTQNCLKSWVLMIQTPYPITWV